MSGPHGSKGLRQAEDGLPGTPMAWKVQVRRAQGLSKVLLGTTPSFGHKSPLWGGNQGAHDRVAKSEPREDQGTSPGAQGTWAEQAPTCRWT